MSQDPNVLASLIQNMLTSPHTEMAIRLTMLQLASENVKFPVVVEALVNSVLKQKTSQAQKETLSLLMDLEPSRFPDIKAFHQVLLEVLKSEKEKNYRAVLLAKVSSGLNLNPELAQTLFDHLGDEHLSEVEQNVIVNGISNLSHLNEDIVIKTLQKATSASVWQQSVAINMALATPSWSEELVRTVACYLQSQFDQDLRVRIISKLAEVKKLGEEYIPVLLGILKNENDFWMRLQALVFLNKIQPWGVGITEALTWTSQNDRDESVRSKALSLLNDHKSQTLDLNNSRALVERFFSESNADLRSQILSHLRSFIREVEVRTLLIHGLASMDLTRLKDGEFFDVMNLLIPYASREDQVKNIFFDVIKRDTRSERRLDFLNLILPKIKIQEEGPWLVEQFVRERNESIRHVLFQHLKPLSLAKTPSLITVFCQELIEPSSAYRLNCAEALALVIESHSEVTVAFEDVLLHDQERDLIRVCLDAYLKPKVAVKFGVLLAVIKNEKVDLTSRQKALNKLFQSQISASEQQELQQALAAPMAVGLKV